VLWH
jgi:hypothetical protein